MPSGIAPVDAVIFVWIEEGVKLLVCCDQGIDQVHGVLEVNIVIARPMDEQEVAPELVYMRNRTVVIVSCGIELRGLQVALGVDRVIVSPSRHRSYRDRCLKNV